ncbi:MAG TPA: hypothetical protein VM029_17670 [Opitutaceae bacterium]|nr:hypothetical protein [Opitutaceae bacterium]
MDFRFGRDELDFEAGRDVEERAFLGGRAEFGVEGIAALGE